MNDSSETAKLLDRIREGDRQSFERLFARHRDALVFAVRMRMDDQLRARVDPSDVVQETHLEAFRRLDDFLERRPMPFRLWLRKTAQERLIKIRQTHVQAARRSVQREIPLPEKSSMDLAHRLIAKGASPSEDAKRADLGRQVRQALAQLSDKDRDLLLLRYVERYSNQEIACVLGLSSNAVSKRHGRALLQLQRILSQLGLGDTT